MANITPDQNPDDGLNALPAPSGEDIFSLQDIMLPSRSERSLVSDIISRPTAGAEVTISGMVDTVREFKHHAFVIVRDRSGTLQTVLEKNDVSELPSVGAYVSLTGAVKINPKSRNGVELVAKEVTTLSKPESDLSGLLDRPLEESLDIQIGNRARTIRNRVVRDIFAAQALVTSAFRDVMETNGFVEIHTPKIVSGGTEGGAEVFSVDYFGSPASLAQSPQIYKQIVAGAFERVYEVGPVFRAEKSSTNRHLTEFTGLDYEMALISDQQEVMDVEEKFVRRLVELLNQRFPENKASHLQPICEVGDIPRITWEEATALIEKYGTAAIDKNFDRAVGEAVEREFGAQFVFVYQYPDDEKPFYIQPSTEKPGFTESFDLLCGGLEISSGGKRIHELPLLLERMKQHGLNPADNPGYIQAFELGMPPHGGAGMGLERITQIVLGLTNVREASLFPRDAKRLTP